MMRRRDNSNADMLPNYKRFTAANKPQKNLARYRQQSQCTCIDGRAWPAFL
jgi:hypothetical protein